MDDDRLQALLLCSIETDLFYELTDEELIQINKMNLSFFFI
jgi:hypothetical protein